MPYFIPQKIDSFFILKNLVKYNQYIIYKMTTNPQYTDDDNGDELANIQPIPLTRQQNQPRFLKYTPDGTLVDQDGTPTTPEQHNTTHFDIISNIRKYRRYVGLDDDAFIVELIHKYLS